MSQEEAFALLKRFFEEQTTVAQALQNLESGVEIRVLIDNRLECALYYAVNQVHFESRKAKSPDVQFLIWPEGVRRISAMEGGNVGQLGIDIVKQIIAGNIQVSVVSSLWDVMGNGYLKIIKEAGPEFTGFLASHGLKSVSKIISLIRSLKS